MFWNTGIVRTSQYVNTLGPWKQGIRVARVQWLSDCPSLHNEDLSSVVSDWTWAWRTNRISSRPQCMCTRPSQGPVIPMSWTSISTRILLLECRLGWTTWLLWLRIGIIKPSRPCLYPAPLMSDPAVRLSWVLSRQMTIVLATAAIIPAYIWKSQGTQR